MNKKITSMVRLTNSKNLKDPSKTILLNVCFLIVYESGMK